MVSDVVKKVKILATHEEYKEIWIKECVSQLTGAWDYLIGEGKDL